MRFLAIFAVVLLLLPVSASAKKAKYEVVAELDQGPGNITVTPDGRIIVSQHQFFDPTYRVVEVMKDGTTKPFPNEAWSTAPDENGIGMTAVLGVRADHKGIVWMLDNGNGSQATPKVVAWNTRTDELHRVVYIPAPATIEGSFHNDLALDPLHEKLYLADFAAGGEAPAIVVVDLVTGLSRRVLHGHHTVLAEDGAEMMIDDRPVQMLDPDGVPFEPKVGINPITIDVGHQWVYYGAMHGTSLFRVQTKDLIDEDLTPNQLGARVERFADKPVSDGISIDARGHVYVTDVNNNAMGVSKPDGSYTRLFRDDKLFSWPDAISAGNRNDFYMVTNQLHRTAVLNAGEDITEAPFHVIRFTGLGPAVVGR